MTLLIGFFTVLLILASLLMILIILMQRPRSDSGLGAALGGGGAAESAFGAESGNILSRSTIYCSIFFFVVSFGLYLGHMYANHREPVDARALPEMRPADGEEAGESAAPADLPIEMNDETEAVGEPVAPEADAAEEPVAPESEAVEETPSPAPAEEGTSEEAVAPESTEKVSEPESADAVPEESAPPAPLN